MDIIIPDSWLREFLKTKAQPEKIAESLSFCGPSVGKLEKIAGDYLYHLEITTNRVDTASVYGFAREGAAILPRFGLKARLLPPKLKAFKPPKKSLPLKIKSNPALVKRTLGVILADIKNWHTPKFMSERLELVGIRSINAVVDITNYLMIELGQPCHAFDYDKIKEATIVIRESKKNEKIVSLENKQYSLPGGDIVFESIDGEIIDLPGIIGTRNSIVTKDTNQVLLFIDINDPSHIRHSSMTLGIRTMAAIINEKGVDPESSVAAILRGIELYTEICGARVASRLYDHYHARPKRKQLKIDYHFLVSRLGITIKKQDIKTILASLSFGAQWRGNELSVTVPSFRANDVSLPEDIIEEVARLWGYHNLPSAIMAGELPQKRLKEPFSFELEVKNTLSKLGGVEIYSQSLTDQKSAGAQALKLVNPLGEDSAFLRTALFPSVVKVARQNAKNQIPFHIFEIANIYLPKKGELPKEKMLLAGVFYGYQFRASKGAIEKFLDELNITFKFNPRMKIVANKSLLGRFLKVDESLFYYEFDLATLQKVYQPVKKFRSLPKYPPQIEDITFEIPEKTFIGEVIEKIKSADKQISKVELTDSYKNNFTFKVHYQHPEKTLTDAEVERVRKKIITKVRKRFGGIARD